MSRAGTDRGFPDYSNTPRFTVHCHMGNFQVDVVRYGHRRSSPLNTVEFVPLCDYMYMEVPSFYGKHPTTLSRSVQMVGKLATPFDSVHITRLIDFD